jgi:putative FmdB family regulatory protein
MPTYQYRCKQCGHELEEYQQITEDPLVHCPRCHTDNLVRVVGAGAGLIFKGSGFYLTDYKKDQTRKGETSKKEGPAPKGDTSKPSSEKPNTT